MKKVTIGLPINPCTPISFEPLSGFKVDIDLCTQYRTLYASEIKTGSLHWEISTHHAGIKNVNCKRIIAYEQITIFKRVIDITGHSNYDEQKPDKDGNRTKTAIFTEYLALEQGYEYEYDDSKYIGVYDSPGLTRIDSSIHYEPIK